MIDLVPLFLALVFVVVALAMAGELDGDDD